MTGKSKDLRNKIQKVGIQYCFKEDTSAVNGETLLCLKKLGAGYWDVCEDLNQYVEMLIELEKQNQSTNEEGRASAVGESRSKLRMDTFYGETDILIGKSGEAFFRNAFREEVCGDVITFNTMEIEGADHDSVIECWRGPFERIFQGAKEGLA